MPDSRYPFFHILVQRFAITRPGRWFFIHAAHRSDQLFHRLTGSSTSLLTIFSGLPALTITTLGAKSGLPRTLPLAYIRDDLDASRLVLVASNFGQKHNPGWYYNLKANPRATCTIDSQPQVYLAHEVVGEEYERLWQLAMQVFPGYATYRRSCKRHVPIMVLEKVGG